MRVAVTGAGGQLGAAIVHEFRRSHDVVPLTRAALDVTDEAAVLSVVGSLKPEAIINCAADNRVDALEDLPVEALNANAFAVRNLSRAAAGCGAILVHYSTDFVFNGRVTVPYTEEDQPNPLSVYAASKLLGEWFAAGAPQAYVLRVETLFGRAPGGPAPKGSVAGLVRAFSAGDSPNVFADRTISPTYVDDAARASRLLLERQLPIGLYHCVNSGSCTWLEFATELGRQIGAAAKPTPVTMADVALRAMRPQYCALSNEKLRANGVDLPHWRDALRRYLQSLRDEGAHQPAHRE